MKIKNVIENYQRVADDFDLETIQKEIDLREILQLRENLESCEKAFRKKHGHLFERKLNISFGESYDSELEDAKTLIKNRRSST